MAETREVIFKMTVAQRDAAQQMKEVADNTEAASKAAAHAEENFRRMSRAAQAAAYTGQNDPAGPPRSQRAMQRGFARNRLDEMIAEQQERRGGGGAWSRPLNTMGVGLGGLVGGYVGLSAAQGTAHGAEQLAAASGRAGEAFRLMTQSIVDSIPVIGTLNRTIGTLAEAVTGVAAVKAGAHRFLAGATAQNELFGTQRELRFGAANELNQFRIQRSGLADTTAGASAYRAALEEAGVLESLRPRARFGEATEATGGVRAGLLQSQATYDSTTRRLSTATRGLGESQDSLRDLRGQTPGLRSVATSADQRAQEIARMAENEAGPAEGFKAREMEYAARAAAANQRLAENQHRIAEQELQVKERIRQVEAAQNELAQRGYNVAQARLAVDRDRLVIVTQQVEAGRAGAAAAGASRPGELQATAAAIRQAQQYGIETTTDQQRALIGGFGPAGQDFLQRRFEERGRNLPGFQEVQGLLGQQPLGGLENQRAALQDAIERGGAVAAEKLAQETEGAFNRAMDKIADALVRIVDVKMGELAAKIDEKRNRQILEGNR